MLLIHGVEESDTTGQVNNKKHSVQNSRLTIKLKDKVQDINPCTDSFTDFSVSFSFKHPLCPHSCSYTDLREADTVTSTTF